MDGAALREADGERSPWWRLGSLGLLRWLVEGAAGVYLGAALVALVYAVMLAGHPAVGWRALLVVVKPSLLVGLTIPAALAMAVSPARGVPRRAALALGATGVAVLLDAWQTWGWRWPDVGTLLAMAAVAAAVDGALCLLRRGPGGRWRSASRVGIVAAAYVLVAAASGGPLSSTNHLGLMAGSANRTDVQDFAQQSNKDDYPVCTFRYNSFGYRDEEPRPLADGRRRVLLIGDSYVWGDGIPTNEETLSYRLRERLEQLAPGRFDVISAAWPGLDLYGYVRVARVLAPLWSAHVVVISSLDDSELSDPQFLLDRANAVPGLLRLLQAMGVMSQAHVAFATYNRGWHRSSARARWRAALLDELAQDATRNGYELLFLNYSVPRSGGGFPDAIRRLDLPEALRYPGHSTELWYAKDNHPKPPLIDIVAGLLAEALGQP